MAKNGTKALPNILSVKRNYSILIEGYRNIGENQGILSRILLKISGEIRVFFPEILVATLSKH